MHTRVCVCVVCVQFARFVCSITTAPAPIRIWTPTARGATPLSVRPTTPCAAPHPAPHPALLPLRPALSLLFAALCSALLGSALLCSALRCCLSPSALHSHSSASCVMCCTVLLCRVLVVVARGGVWWRVVACGGGGWRRGVWGVARGGRFDGSDAYARALRPSASEFGGQNLARFRSER